MAASESASRRPLEQLEREICELAAHIAAATCRWLMLVAEFDARHGWAEWGMYSCAHWLSWRCSIAPRSAREHCRVARALTILPLVREAFARGELSYSKVRAVTRVATPETDAELVEIARHATGAQLDKLVRAFGGVIAATSEHAQDVYARRALHYAWEDDGSLSLNARLGPEEGALVLAALKTAEAQALDGDQPRMPEEPVVDGFDVPPGAAARRADGLVALARLARAGADAAHTSTDPYEITVHVDVETLSGDRVHERSELTGGPALAPDTVRRLGCDASVVRILERDGRPLSVGRRRRTIAPALRRALRSRDSGCRFPGCTHSRFLHAHHIRHWAHGGPTELSNLVQLCSRHHRLVHEGGFGVERSVGGRIVFRRPDGRLVNCAPATPCASNAQLEQRNRELGLEIDAWTCVARSAGDRLDYSIAVDALVARTLAGT